MPGVTPDEVARLVAVLGEEPETSKMANFGEASMVDHEFKVYDL